MKDWHLHEIAVIVLSEVFFKIKLNYKTMKELIIKISIHMFFSNMLTGFECLITQHWGQALSLDRLSNKSLIVNVINN